jgi:hypothetical protein
MSQFDFGTRIKARLHLFVNLVPRIIIGIFLLKQPVVWQPLHNCKVHVAGTEQSKNFKILTIL